MNKEWTPGLLAEWLRIVFASSALKRELRKQSLVWHAPLSGVPIALLSQLTTVSEHLVNRTWQWLNEESDYERGVYALSHPDYPQQLKQIAHAPWLLFWEGQEDLLSSQQVAIIGSRNASIYACQITEKITQDLVAAGLCITSGLATGIDSVAHQAAIAHGGKTIAVQGCGPDICYPARSKKLKQAIYKQGLIVSEYLPGTAPITQHFPARNRIISGLSRGVLVTAAAQKSGSIMTAQFAAEQNRDVFALPYGIDDPLGVGCHWLIQQGAKLVTSAADILEEWSDIKPNTQSHSRQLHLINQQTLLSSKIYSEFSLASRQILATLSARETSLEELLQQSGLQLSELMNELIQLEVDGIIKAVPGGYVRIVPRPG